MGRPVHRHWRTLILQAENGAVRLRHELGEMRRLNPGVDLDRWIRVSLPPEGGLPFHRPEFRQRVSMLVREFRPDMVVLDPWTQVAVDDTSKDIVDALPDLFAGREAMTREELRDKLIEAGLCKYSTAARHTDIHKGFLVADGHLVTTPMGLLARK